jgi:glutamyl-tRNA reductase
MTTDDYNLLKVGYLRKVSNHERIVRRAACAIMQPWIKEKVKEWKLWYVYGDEELIRKHREESEKETLKVLNRHKKGGFTYQKIDGKIIPVPIQEN